MCFVKKKNIGKNPKNYFNRSKGFVDKKKKKFDFTSFDSQTQRAAGKLPRVGVSKTVHSVATTTILLCVCVCGARKKMKMYFFHYFQRWLCSEGAVKPY